MQSIDPTAEGESSSSSSSSSSSNSSVAEKDKKGKVTFAEELAAAKSPKTKKIIEEKDLLLPPQQEEEEETPYDLHGLKEEFPELLNELLEMRARLSPDAPSAVLNKQKSINATESVRKATAIPAFPKMALLAIAVSLFFYQYTSNLLAVGPLVSLFNFIAAAGTIGYIMWNINAIKS